MASSFRERNRINKLLLILYVVTFLVAPMVILTIGFNTTFEVLLYPEFIRQSGYILFLIVSIPTYAIYAYMMIKEKFPEKNLNAFLLFIPILFASVVYFFSDSKNFFEKLISDSLPFYLGLNIMFFIGLNILFIQNMKGASDKLLRIIVAPILLIVLFFPAGFLMTAGYELSIKNAQTETEVLKELSKYFISIALVIVFHYKTLKGLYEKGLL